MSSRRFALVAAFAFLVMFIASNLIVNSWFKGWRLDLTANHLYSLSPGTQTTLDHLSEPVELTFYYSRDVAAGNAQVQAYGARVREMLQTFAAHSRGRVRFVEVNVKRYSEEEDKASAAGIEPQQLQQGGDPLYFGLVGANAINDTRTIPFFNPQREPFLEYEVTRLIYELENPDPPRVTLITSLPIDPAAAANPAPGGAQQQWAFAIELGRFMHVTKLPADFTEIPADTDVLAIIHPAALTPAQDYAIDQFILRKGRAFIALDPASISAQRAGGQMAMLNPQAAQNTSSDLEPLLHQWGVTMSQDVVLDLENGLPVQAQNANGQPVQAPQPLLFHVPPEQFDHSDLMTAALSRGMNFGLAGSLSVSERPNLHADPLVRTSPHTMRMEAARAMSLPSPFELMQEPPPLESRVETLALHLSGPLQTAFPNGPPDATPAGASAQLRQSAAPAQIVIVSDSDFLDDQFYMDQSGATAADNGAFALNALAVLSGNDALVSLRSRAPAARPMTLLDHMEADAQRRIESQQQELQAQLEETEQRLQELQAHGQGSGFFTGNLNASLTTSEAQEIQHFQQQVASVRSQLRGVQRSLRGDITALQSLIVFVDMWLGPMLVAGAGLFLFWRRQRRGRGKTPAVSDGARA